MRDPLADNARLACLLTSTRACLSRGTTPAMTSISAENVKSNDGSKREEEQEAEELSNNTMPGAARGAIGRDVKRRELLSLLVSLSTSS